MAAWLVTTVHLTDKDAFLASGYAAAAAAALARYGGEYLVRAGGATFIEGEGRDGASVLVTQWPSREAALAFYNSPEYAEAKTLRRGIGEITSCVVGG